MGVFEAVGVGAFHGPTSILFEAHSPLFLKAAGDDRPSGRPGRRSGPRVSPFAPRFWQQLAKPIHPFPDRSPSSARVRFRDLYFAPSVAGERFLPSMAVSCRDFAPRDRPDKPSMGWGF